jgi:hypothetical protein
MKMLVDGQMKSHMCINYVHFLQSLREEAVELKLIESEPCY